MSIYRAQFCFYTNRSNSKIQEENHSWGKKNFLYWTSNCLLFQRTCFFTYFSGIHVVICYVFTCLVTYCDVRYDFREKRCSVRLYSYLYCRGFMFHLLYLYLFLRVYYQYWCPTRYPYHIMCMPFSSNNKGVTSGAGIVYPFRVTLFSTGFL